MTQERRGSGKITLARVIAALVALIVIGGSILAFVLPKTGEKTGGLGLSSAYADGFKTLKKGSSGAEVRKAQQALKDLGYYTGRVDGNFSKVFEEAVLAFQKDWGLKETGALDEETFLLITEDVGDVPPETAPPKAGNETPFVEKGQAYSDKDRVAAYLHAFGELPPNFISKTDAEKLGWDGRQNTLWQVAPDKSIGGDLFGNYEDQLPVKKGRKYFECDIDYNGRVRGLKRIVFSSDGLIFYTEDHYSTFEEITFEE